jgi:hypothetical protein
LARAAYLFYRAWSMRREAGSVDLTGKRLETSPAHIVLKAIVIGCVFCSRGARRVAQSNAGWRANKEREMRPQRRHISLFPLERVAFAMMAP